MSFDHSISIADELWIGALTWDYELYGITFPAYSPTPDETSGLFMAEANFNVDSTLCLDPSVLQYDMTRKGENLASDNELFEINISQNFQPDTQILQASAPLSGTSLPKEISDLRMPLPTLDVTSSIESAPHPISFTDCLHEFEAGPKNELNRRKRKRFPPERRREVSQLRKVGACIRCRLTKSSCQLDQPCSSCVKVCGNHRLGRTLCVRQSLLNIRFSSDLWHRISDINWLDNEVTPLVGPRRSIEVFLSTGRNFDIELARANLLPVEIYPSYKKESPLVLQVQNFSPTKGRENSHVMCVGDSELLVLLPDQALSTSYAVPPDSLPTLEDIEAWALGAMVSYPIHASFGWLRSAFLHFARAYCITRNNLPLKPLIWKAVRLSALHGVWSRALSLPRERVEDPKQYASVAVHVQLDVIVTKGIIDLEVELLSCLEKQIKVLGKGNMLPVWICLWLLILTYRDTTNAYFLEDDGKDGLPELAGQMYHMLISIYSGLFRTSSPLRLNWLNDDIYELFGRDQHVTHSMGTLKTEFRLFDQYKGHHHKNDTLLRSLIFEREMEGLKPAPDPLSKHYLKSSRTAHGYVPIDERSSCPTN